MNDPTRNDEQAEPETAPEKPEKEVESSFYEASETPQDDPEDDFEEPPAPKKLRRRPWWVSALFILICLYFIVSLSDELFYYFQRSQPIPLGDSIGFAGTDLPSSTFVSIFGTRNPSKGIRLNALFVDRNVFQLLGTKNVWVETLVKDDELVRRDGLTRELYSGRLFRFSDLDYFDTVRDFAAYNFGIDVPEDAIVIRVHEKPGDMWIVPLAYLAFLVIIGVNVFLLVRRLRQD